MKRSNAFNKTNRGVFESQSKRIRTTTTLRDKENDVSMINTNVPVPNCDKSTRLDQIEKKLSNNNVLRESQSATTANARSESTISFAPPSTASANTDTSISTNNRNVETSGENSIATRSAISSCSQPIVSRSTSHKPQKEKQQSFTQASNPNRLSRLFEPSLLNNSSTSTSSNNSHSAHIEGSLEFRELRRLYNKEKSMADEWRKDYGILKGQMATLKATTIPRPTAEVLEWLSELFDIISSNGVFVGDGRSLEQIGHELGIDTTSLATISARTPQKSALKIFRLLYPTVGSRANCGSISAVPQEQLENIYAYVRTLHKSLSFSMSDLRKAIGTSIRTATADIRRMHLRGQQQLNDFSNDLGFDSNVTGDSARDVYSDMDENGPDDQESDEENESGDDNEDSDDEFDRQANARRLVMDDEDEED
ncbi:unnamed protein product [Adineta ricciae]|uniref:Uncharacterized protein n=1 Tax=Adineta ricciae TaxID=249248 RepID=A0A815X6W1_ADIRI|nr:unnamed protein product [Adineta ricciae]CAF1551767.1 unnamed protein product [Adineta ricciae]